MSLLWSRAVQGLQAMTRAAMLDIMLLHILLWGRRSQYKFTSLKFISTVLPTSQIVRRRRPRHRRIANGLRNGGSPCMGHLQIHLAVMMSHIGPTLIGMNGITVALGEIMAIIGLTQRVTLGVPKRIGTRAVRAVRVNRALGLNGTWRVSPMLRPQLIFLRQCLSMHRYRRAIRQAIKLKQGRRDPPPHFSKV